MKRKNSNLRFIVPCFMLWLLLPPASEAGAAVSVSVSPLAGGSSLRFDRIDITSSNTKEVRLRVTSGDGEQYQIFQRVVEPLTNERGESLDLEAVQSYTLIGSNAQGTLYQQDLEGLSQSEQLLYTANSQGNSDAFTVIYQINPERINAGGNFVGKVLYTVSPIGSGSPVESVLTVYLDVTAELKITAQSETGGRTLQLESGVEQKQKTYFKISFEGNGGRALKVYQEIIEFPQNESDTEMTPELVSFAADSKGGQNFAVQPLPLKRGRVLLLETKEEVDELLVHFELNREIANRQKAGTYRGRINYLVDQDGAVQSIPVELETVVNPVFNLQADFPEGKLHFGQVLPNGVPQVKEVKVTIHSNLGKPYMVSQNVQASLTNEKGEIVPAGLFTFRVVLEQGRGKSQFPEFVSIEPGDKPIFYSDAKGSSSEFRIQYRLRPDDQLKAGDYSAGMVLSLGEI